MVKKLLCCFALFALLTGVYFTSLAAPESVTCPQLLVEVVLDEAGTATVLEHWTLTMDETVDRFSRSILLTAEQSAVDWELSEEKGEGLNLPYTPVEEPSAEPVASTLLLTQNGTTTHAEWYFTPEAKTRTFTLGYIVKNAVARHADVAEYATAFSNSDYPFGIEKIIVRIQLPVGEGAFSMVPTAYLHGTLQTESRYLPDEDTLEVQATGIPANTLVDIRAVFHSARVPNQVADEETHKDTIVAQEAELQQQAERAPILFWIYWGVLALLLAAILTTGIVVRRKTRRACARFLTEDAFDPSFEAPQALLPAALPDFYYFYSPKAEDLRGKRVIATLLDLFARGVIDISVNKDDSLLARDTVVFVKKSDLPESASEAEKILVSLLFDRIGGGSNRCTMSDLKRYGRHNTAKLGEQLSLFDAASRRAFNSYGLVDKSLTRKKRGALLCTFLSLGLAGLFALLGALLDLRLMLFVPVLLITCFLTGGCLSLRRLTESGESAFMHWHTYRHFLKDFSEAETLPEQWESTVINAAALGVLDRVLPQLAGREIPLITAFPHFHSLFEDGGMTALLATASVFDSYPHAKLHSYHEE